MRWPTLTARGGVTLCLALAAAALWAGGSIGPVHALVLACACAATRRDLPTLPRRVWDALAIAALLLFALDALALSGNLIGAALRLLTFVTIHRCLDMARPGGPRQALSLSFVQMVAAAASTTESWFVFFLVPYLCAAVATLMALTAAGPTGAGRPVRVSAGRAVPIAAAVGAAGLAIFFIIPHFGTGYFRPATSTGAARDTLSGFSDRVELGSIGRIKKDTSVAMRVRADRPVISPESTLWRGLAFDTFDGRSWSHSAQGSRRRWVAPARSGWLEVGAPQAATPDRVEHHVTLEPGVHPVLIAPAHPERVASRDFISLGIDAEGALHLRAPRAGRLAYRCLAPPPGVPVAADDAPLDPADHARYTDLPRRDTRLADLARRAAGDAAGDFERARRIEDWLEGSFDYTLDIDDAGVEDPLEHFLIERRAGHCEYFATSMAVLLRHLGIPSRLVTGYSAGEWSTLTASWIVRNSDAHTWVEAWIPERGWTPFDPTPPDDTVTSAAGVGAWMRDTIADLEIAWDTWIVGLDLLDQQSMAAGLRDAAVATARAAAGLVPDVPGSIAGLIPAARPDREWSRLARSAALMVLLIPAAALAAVPRLRRAAWLALLAASPVTRTARATRRLRRFEARWAARGFRRLPGQTPMEFAAYLQARDPARATGAPGLIRDYYLARYGSRAD